MRLEVADVAMLAVTLRNAVLSEIGKTSDDVISA